MEKAESAKTSEYSFLSEKGENDVANNVGYYRNPVKYWFSF